MRKYIASITLIGILIISILMYIGMPRAINYNTKCSLLDIHGTYLKDINVNISGEYTLNKRFSGYIKIEGYSMTNDSKVDLLLNESNQSVLVYADVENGKTKSYALGTIQFDTNPSNLAIAIVDPNKLQSSELKYANYIVGSVEESEQFRSKYY